MAALARMRLQEDDGSTSDSLQTALDVSHNNATLDIGTPLSACTMSDESLVASGKQLSMDMATRPGDASYVPDFDSTSPACIYSELDDVPPMRDPHMSCEQSTNVRRFYHLPSVHLQYRWNFAPPLETLGNVGESSCLQPPKPSPSCAFDVQTSDTDRHLYSQGKATEIDGVHHLNTLSNRKHDYVNHQAYVSNVGNEENGTESFSCSNRTRCAPNLAPPLCASKFHFWEWEDVDDLTLLYSDDMPSLPAKAFERVLAWDDCDELAEPKAGEWFNPCYHVWQRKYTAHLRVSCDHVYLPLPMKTSYVCSRHTSWRVRRVSRTCSTRTTVRNWRQYCRLRKTRIDRKNRTEKREYTTKGLRLPSQTDEKIEAFYDMLGVRVASESSHDIKHLNLAHTMGDGNCFWRALWATTAAAPCWRKLKKQVLRSHIELLPYRPFGVFANCECFAAAASYLGVDVHVTLPDVKVGFRPPQNIKDRLCRLVVQANHATSLLPTSATRARAGIDTCTTVHSECGVCQGGLELASSTFRHSSLTVGAGQSKGDTPDDSLILHFPRTRRGRYHVKLDEQPTFSMFVDAAMSHERAAMNIAMHLGVFGRCCTQDTSDAANACTPTVLCTTPHMKKRDWDSLDELAMSTPLASAQRTFTQRTLEAFLGHRATRARGILAVTHKVQPRVLAAANQAIKQIFPDFVYTSVAILWHQNVGLHTDPATSNIAIMTTLRGKSPYLSITSPLTERLEARSTMCRFVVFNPQRPHAVSAKSMCLSLVFYQTLRSVHVDDAITLRSLGFPVCVTDDTHDLTTNYTLSMSDGDDDGEATSEGKFVDDDDLHVRVAKRKRITEDALDLHERDMQVGSPPETQKDHNKDRDQISPTLSYHSAHLDEDNQTVDFNHNCLLSGAVDQADLSRMVQSVKNMDFGIPVKTVRALLTLDAKLRKTVKEHARNPDKVRASIDSCLQRWNMVVPTASATQQSNRGTARNRARTQDAPSGNDGGGWREVRSRKPRMPAQSLPVEKKIRLCQTAWPIPVKEETDFKPDEPGVYQIRTRDVLQTMAVQAVHSPHPVIAIAPFKTDLGYAPPKQLVLPFTIEEGAINTRAHLTVWVHQLSAEEVIPVSPPNEIAISISGTDSSSCIISACVDVVSLSHQDVEEAITRPAKARQIIASLLPKALAGDPLLDVFKLSRVSGRWINALLRVKNTHVDEYLRVSGVGALWLNTPRHLTDSSRVIWMKEAGSSTVPMPLDEVRTKHSLLPQPLGIVAKPGGTSSVWSYAIRVRVQDYQAAQRMLAVDPKETFYIRGIPTGVTEKDMQEIISQMQWDATVVEGSRRVFRGKASMAAKAGAPPSVAHCTVRIDSEHVHLHIMSRKAHARPHTLPPRATGGHQNGDSNRATTIEASTWEGALRGRYKKTETATSEDAAPALTYAQITQNGTPYNGSNGYDELGSASVANMPNANSSPSRASSYREGDTKWWRGSNWVRRGTNWVKIQDTHANEDGPAQRLIQDDSMGRANEEEHAEEVSRKRLSFARQGEEDGNGVFIRATAKRRTDSAEAGALQTRLNESRALLSIYQNVMQQYGISCPEHSSMMDDEDDDVDEDDVDRYADDFDDERMEDELLERHLDSVVDEPRSSWQTTFEQQQTAAPMAGNDALSAGAFCYFSPLDDSCSVKCFCVCDYDQQSARNGRTCGDAIDCVHDRMCGHHTGHDALHAGTFDFSPLGNSVSVDCVCVRLCSSECYEWSDI
eukprot:6492335-Amphidinium_carterae.2